MVLSHCKGILNCFHRLLRMKENFPTRLLHIGIAPFCIRIMVKQVGAALLVIGTGRSSIVCNINGLGQSKCLLCRHIHSRADGYIFLIRPVTNEHKAVAHYCAAQHAFLHLTAQSTEEIGIAGCHKGCIRQYVLIRMFGRSSTSQLRTIRPIIENSGSSAQHKNVSGGATCQTAAKATGMVICRQYLFDIQVSTLCTENSATAPVFTLRNGVIVDLSAGDLYDGSNFSN